VHAGNLHPIIPEFSVSDIDLSTSERKMIFARKGGISATGKFGVQDGIPWA
jgi:hypothetical protein